LDRATDGTDHTEYTFTQPGLRRWSVTTLQQAQYNAFTTRPFADTFTVDVFARATVAAPDHQRPQAVRRRGLRVTANAFTGSVPADVVLVLRAEGATLGRTSASLGATPAAARVRLTTTGRQRVRSGPVTARLVLRQGRKALVSAPVTIG
ncbi:MAG: hypothetical protein QOF76_4118, partial [Solirubrobacteraceae bacterium]|nr:hypothetical protein [Solirubrobacteraceae bacterium]